MKKSIVVLGLFLSQSAAMFADVEDAQGVASPNVAGDTLKSDSSAALVVEESVPATSEAKVFDESTVGELNDLGELPEAKPLPEYRETTIGVTIAGGASWYNSTPTNNKTVPCLRGGLNFDIPIGQWFSLQPELLFATRGGGFDVTYLDVDDNGNLVGGSIGLKENLFYFDVPINCKFSKRMNFSKTTTGRGFVSVGPVLSLGVYGQSKGGDVKNKVFQNDMDNEMEHSIYRNFDFSLNFRAGYDFDAGYSVAVGYQLGLFNLMNDGNFDANEKEYYQGLYGSEFPTVKNNSLYLSLGYRW